VKTRSTWIRVLLLIFLGIALVPVPSVSAKGPRGGGRSSARPSRPPRVAAPRRPNVYKPPKMPRASAPARAKAPRPTIAKNNTRANLPRTASTVPSRSARVTPPRISTYSNGTRNHRAYGYGRGYRNRYYGSRRGYGRSQANNRAIVARLRSVHANLARIDREYKGHRVRAMQSIALAIRQLSHRSMVYRGTGFAPGVNNQNLALRNQQGVRGANGQRRPLTQAQADARMNQSLRTMQGIFLQLNNQGYHTNSHARASGHIQRAIQHLSAGLANR